MEVSLTNPGANISNVVGVLVNPKDGIFKQEAYYAKAIIICGGRSPRKSSLENEKDYIGKVFAYIICSDKCVADSISNKEKEINSSSDAAPIDAKELNQSLANSKGKDAQSSAVEKTERTDNKIEETDSDSEDEYSDNDEIMQFGSSDLVFSKKDYYFSGNTEFSMRNNVEIMHHSIKDRDDISNHIVICGLHPALVHFILPLRAKYLKEDSDSFLTRP